MAEIKCQQCGGDHYNLFFDDIGKLIIIENCTECNRDGDKPQSDSMERYYYDKDIEYKFIKK